jgi:hypothetical protein
VTGRLLPFPGLRWGSVWLAPGQVAEGLVRVGLEEEIEHARVGGPVSQGIDRVAVPGLAQLLQQFADGRRVAEAGVGGGPGGQGLDRVAVPGRAQCPQQPGNGPRVGAMGPGKGCGARAAPVLTAAFVLSTEKWPRLGPMPGLLVPRFASTRQDPCPAPAGRRAAVRTPWLAGWIARLSPGRPRCQDPVDQISRGVLR